MYKMVFIYQYMNTVTMQEYQYTNTDCARMNMLFVLFQVTSWLFSIPLRTINNTKTHENVSVCTGPEKNCNTVYLEVFL